MQVKLVLNLGVAVAALAASVYWLATGTGEPWVGLIGAVGSVIAALAVLPRHRPGKSQLVTTIQWIKFSPDRQPDIFELLDWRSRMTPLIGRDQDLQAILDWAGLESRVLVRFLIGPGGAGKTRLALEAAQVLRDQGWDAGQIYLDKPFRLPTDGRKLFLVIDYPEAARSNVEKALSLLARLESAKAPIRVLLLSRLELRVWEPVLDAASAAGICDSQELRLSPLSAENAQELFAAAVASYSSFLELATPAGGEAVDWELAESSSEAGRLPLLVAASALEQVLSRGEGGLASEGQVVHALVRRQLRRLTGLSTGAGWRSDALARLCGLATLRGSLDSATLARLAADPEFGLPPQGAIDELIRLGYWQHDRFPALTPDLVAAELLFQILVERQDRAPAWIWLTLEDQIVPQLDRIGRTLDDIEVLRGPDSFHSAARWLAASIESRLDRAEKWRGVFEDERLPVGLLPLAVAIGELFVERPNLGRGERVFLHSMLATHFRNLGNGQKALENSRRAEELGRPFVRGKIEEKALLVRCLVGLAADLWRQKNIEEALGISRQAVKISESLKGRPPYRQDLARSLRMESICLAELAEPDKERSLELCRNAVEIWRQLAASDPSRYRADLGQSLNTLSVVLDETGHHEGSLEASREAVEIWEKLVAESPSRYRAELARSQGNLASFLQKSGDHEGFLRANGEALRIYGRMALANPEAFEAAFNRSFESLENDLVESPDPLKLLEPYRRAIQMQRTLSARQPDRHKLVARYLDRLSRDLSDPETALEALEVIQVAAKTVTILLVRGESPDGKPIFAYVAVKASRLETFMEAQSNGVFYPEDFGIIVESGEGDPSLEARRRMEEEFGFNHEGMVVIPNPEFVPGLLESLQKDELKVG